MAEKIQIETKQYLTFHLDEEKFSLDITQVKEVLDFTTITKVPRTPDFMRGVINLRGGVVPVIDLRLKMGMPETVKTVHTRIIIVEVMIDGDPTILGVIADSVEEVCDIDSDMILPPPRIGTRLKTDFIKGMGKLGEDFVIILDIDKVFSSEEIAIANNLEKQREETGMTD
ncbi:chemotaxis protein CheW [Desulforegula conservatrix]|uniref:chemotaxis protein CheW n=1 Tax=Desulforegula conservatrix TaxID=153026 RepID=UPI0004135331|nr:chemotaxis protein CheW [Desulforegula conservatrix]